MKYIITDKESNKVMGVYDVRPSFDEETQQMFEFDGEVPEKEEKQYNTSYLCFDGVEFWTEFTVKVNEANAARFAAKQKCKEDIASFEYKGHPILLDDNNRKEYKEGVDFYLQHRDRIAGLPPLVLRFADGDYTFDGVDDIVDFSIASGVHVMTCNNVRKVEIDRINQLTK